MILLINGTEQSFNTNLNLTQLLTELKIDTERQGLALCLNMQVIPRQSWELTSLKEQDRVEIVIAAPGG